MSKEIVNALAAQFKRAADFYDKFIEICPDNVWAGTAGKFPVWQTVYHAIVCVPFFLSGKDEDTGIKNLYGREVLMFQDLSQPAADKKAMAAYAKQINAWVDKYFASLSDADLAKKHEGFSARVNTPFPTAGVIASLTGHHMYHFGACDAALRNNGLEGLY